MLIIALPSVAINLASVVLAGNKRITNILKICDKGEKMRPKILTGSQYAVLLDNLSASWKENKDDAEHESRKELSPLNFRGTRTSIDMTYDTLSGISVGFVPGKLSTIVGPVGSGKTSFLLTILGELHINRGTLTVNGRIAYSA
jgi:ABC-type transport system involved in cytochrome bd biosynthesis fused ATPase/permease subunit